MSPSAPTPPIPLSVLELANISPGSTAEQALLDVLPVALTADECGYHRMWFAEHHTSPRNAGSAPAVLIAHVAANTQRLRVGSGGVMLPNHAPLIVAEQFAVLRALHGDRIDLGVGRASGGSTSGRAEEEALRRDSRGRHEFPELVDELLGFLHRRWPAGHPFQDLEMSPRISTPPGVYVLGVSENGARIAAGRSLPFVYGHHLGLSKCRPAALDRYRAEFTPGPYGEQPYVMVSLNVLCAETDDEAERVILDIAAQEVHRVARITGAGELPGARVTYLARQALDEAQVLYGSADTVRGGIEKVAAELGADEIMLVPYDPTGDGRCRTLRLAASMALSGRG